jgi:hypothetical protein
MCRSKADGGRRCPGSRSAHAVVSGTTGVAGEQLGTRSPRDEHWSLRAPERLYEEGNPDHYPCASCGGTTVSRLTGSPCDSCARTGLNLHMSRGPAAERLAALVGA